MASAAMLFLTPAAHAGQGHRHCSLDVGHTVRVLPRGYGSVRFGGRRYYTHGGHFYRPFGAGFSLVAPPLGYRFSSLGHRHDSFFFGSHRYARFHNSFYRWDRGFGSYVVVDSPYRSRPAVGSQVFASAGQSGEQRKTDTQECQQLAASETGYDASAGGARAYEYEPVYRGCLEKRGYTVR